VLWLAREGTYIREAKDAKLAYQRLLETVNAMLDYDKDIEIWIEPKPNEPTDQAYVPTIGHALTLSYASKDHKRVKGLIESAHAMLAGLDASDEMAFALAHDKLASVHLNDQNGLKYDQDKTSAAPTCARPSTRSASSGIRLRPPRRIHRSGRQRPSAASAAARSPTTSRTAASCSLRSSRRSAR
jgi:hypothetical protein